MTKYTELELKVIETIGHALNYDTLEANIDDNCTIIGLEEAKKAGLEPKVARGVLSSLVQKGLIWGDDDSLQPNDFWVSVKGLKEYFRLFVDNKKEEPKMVYQNKRNGKITSNVTFDEKFKTYLVEFEDGTSTSVSVSTFKRWYKQVEGTGTIDAPEVVETLPAFTEEEMKEAGIHVLSDDEALEHAVVDPDEVCTDGSKYSDIGKEISKQAEQKSHVALVSNAVDACGFNCKFYDNDPRTIILKNSSGKTIGNLDICKAKFVLALSAKYVPEGYEPNRVRNCLHSHVFDFAYSELDKFEKLLNTIKEEK